MGCSSSTAMDALEGPMSPKRGYKPSKQLLVFRYFGQVVDMTNVGLADVGDSPPVWSVLKYMSGLTPDKGMPHLKDFVANAGVVETRRATAGFANMLQILLHKATKAAEEFVLNFDTEDTWSDKMRNKLLMLIASNMEETWALVAERCGKSAENCSVVIVAQILGALHSLHARPEAQRAGNFVLFHTSSWNRVLRLMMRAVWHGDEVLGDAPHLFAYHAVRAFLQSSSFTAPYSDSTRGGGTSSDRKLGDSSLEKIHSEWFLPLDGYTKASIAHSLLVANNKTDERPTVLKISLSRERTFLDIVDHVVHQERMVGKPDCSPVPTFSPVFTDRFGNPEAGEGHGPRKEMFQLLSSQISKKWSDERKGVGMVVAKRGKRELRIDDDYNSFVAQGVKPGHKLILYLDESISSVPFEVIVASGDDAVRDDMVKLTSIMPYKITNGVEFGVAAPSLPLLEYHQGSESYWPNVKLEYEEDYEEAYLVLGWLMAASILNRSVFSVRLDRLLFRQLIASNSVTNTTKETEAFAAVGVEQWDEEYVPTDRDFREFDRELYDHVIKAVEVSDSRFRSLLQSDAREESTTRSAYVQWRIEQVLVGQVSWQIDAMRVGFRSGLGKVNMALMKQMHVGSGELMEMVCGPVSNDSDFDLSHYYRICLDGVAQEAKTLMGVVWDVIDKWDVAKKRLFLKFFSGLERLPAPGSEDLAVEMPFDAYSLKEHRKMIDMLPQAHTCSNTLEIPSYLESLQELAREDQDSVFYGKDEAELLEHLRTIVDNKFTLAVESQSGYGLDERAQSISVARPGRESKTSTRRSLPFARATTASSSSSSSSDSDSDSSNSHDNNSRFADKKKNTVTKQKMTFSPHGKSDDVFGLSVDLEDSDLDFSMTDSSPAKNKRAAPSNKRDSKPLFFSPADAVSAQPPSPVKSHAKKDSFIPQSAIDEDLNDLEDMLNGLDI